MHNNYSLQDVFDLLDNHPHWTVEIRKNSISQYFFILEEYQHIKLEKRSKGLFIQPLDIADTDPGIYFPLNDQFVRFTFSITSDCITLQKENENVTTAILTPYKTLEITQTKPKYNVGTD